MKTLHSKQDGPPYTLKITEYSGKAGRYLVRTEIDSATVDRIYIPNASMTGAFAEDEDGHYTIVCHDYEFDGDTLRIYHDA